MNLCECDLTELKNKISEFLEKEVMEGNDVMVNIRIQAKNNVYQIVTEKEVTFWDSGKKNEPKSAPKPKLVQVVLDESGGKTNEQEPYSLDRPGDYEAYYHKVQDLLVKKLCENSQKLT